MLNILLNMSLKKRFTLYFLLICYTRFFSTDKNIFAYFGIRLLWTYLCYKFFGPFELFSFRTFGAFLI